MADKAGRCKIVFENRIPTELTCQSDPEQRATVFRNLLDNAAEYSNEGGQIRVDSRRADDSVETTIANTDCRLTGDQVSRVLDSFWRADSSRTDAGAHSGLGLALVRRIVMALGGTITAETEQSDIFMIRLSLPISAMYD